MPPISKMRLSPGGKSFAARRYASTSSTAMGWVGVESHLGQIITGSRSVSDFIRSNDRLPAPMTTEARNSMDLDARSPQNLADLVTAAEVRGEIGEGVVSQPAEVNDASYPGLFCCPGEVRRCLPVFPLKVLRPGHQMDEVVGGVNALQRLVERTLIKNVALHDLGCLPHTGP